MDSERRSMEINRQSRWKLANSLKIASRQVKQSLRQNIPERYRAGYSAGIHYAGIGTAMLIFFVAVYVLLDTAFLAIAPLFGLPVTGAKYTVSIRILGFIVLTLAWDLVGGQMGYATFGNMTFFGIGVYTVVVLLNGTVSWIGTTSFAVAFVAAGLISLLYALIIGFPLLRLDGHYFAVATLGVLIATQQYVANLQQTGGGSGIVISQTGFGNVDRTIYLLFLVLTIATILAYWYLMRSRFGYGLNAIRADEGKVRAMGLHTTKYKIITWGVSAFFTGFAGALFAVHNAFVNPTIAFSLDWTILIILMALVGGMGRLWGPVIGAAFLWTFRNTLWSNPPLVQRASALTGIPFNETYLIIFGILLVVMVIGAPEGILGYLERHNVFEPVRRRLHGTALERFVETLNGGVHR